MGATDDRTRAVRTRVAFHEAGHALIAAIQDPKSLMSVSMVPTGNLYGSTSWSGDIGEGTEADVEALLERVLAGRAAEEIVLGCPSGGAGGSSGSDLAFATLIAASAECSWGLGPRLSWLADVMPDSVATTLASHPGVAQRVENRLQAALEAAKRTLITHRSALDAIADALLRRGVLGGDEVWEIVGGKRISTLKVVL